MSAMKRYMEDKITVIAEALGIKGDVVHAVIFGDEIYSEDFDIYPGEGESELEHTKELCRAVAHEIYKYLMIELAAKAGYKYHMDYLWETFDGECDDAIDGLCITDNESLFEQFAGIVMEHDL